MGTPTYQLHDAATLSALEPFDGFVDCRGEWQDLDLEAVAEAC